MHAPHRRRGGKLEFVIGPTILLAVILVSSSFLGTALAGSHFPSAQPHPDDTTSQAVTFSVDLLPLTSLGISFQLVANTSLSGGSISQGQTISADALVTVPTTIDLVITYNGVETSVAIPGIGTSYDVPVPGLGLSYLGFALGVFLNFSGAIVGQSSVSGPGTGGGGNLSWTASEAKTFAVTANGSAPDGSTITSSLSNLQYGISIGLDAGAAIPLLGNYVIHILNFGSLGFVQGTPSEVQSTYQLPVASGLGGAFSDGTSAVIGLGLILGVILVAIVLVVALRRKRRPPTPMQSAAVQPLLPPPR